MGLGTSPARASFSVRASGSGAAAGFGMLLRGSEHKGSLTWEQARRMAKAAVGKDEQGYRAEMVRLVDKAALLKAASPER